MEFESAALQNDHLIRKWANIAFAGILAAAALEAAAQVLSPHYSIAQAEGDLATGPYGLLMNLCFFARAVFTGYLILALLRCTKQSPLAHLGLFFLGTFGVCSFFLGVFNADVTDSLKAMQPTAHGQIHQMLVILAFVCVGVGLLLVSLSFFIVHRFKPLRMVALVIAMICIISFVFMGQGGIYVRMYGVFERICVGLVLLWGALATIHLRRPNPNNFISYDPKKK